MCQTFWGELLVDCTLFAAYEALFAKEELITVYHALITSLFMYAAPVFGNASSSFYVRIEKFQRRAHKLICNPSCQCDDFPKFSNRVEEASIKFLRSCEAHHSHPLHHLVPPRLRHSGHYRLEHSATTRRLNAFFPFYCMKANEHSVSFWSPYCSLLFSFLSFFVFSSTTTFCVPMS